MKRIIPLILLLLLLCGCTAQPGEETTTQPPETSLTPVAFTEPAGIYEPLSDLEIQTAGAVRLYFPDRADTYGMRLMHGDVLVFSGAENTTLTRYAGEKLFIVAETELDCKIDPEDTAFQISENGITYFNYESYELVFLDNDLKEVRRLQMPAGLTGKPVLSSDRMLIYYCTDDAVRVLDTATGLNKLLKSISYPEQSVENVLLDDTILQCKLKDVQGWEYTVFLSTQDGRLISQIQYEMELTTGSGHYYLSTRDGVLDMILFGQNGQAPLALHPADAFAYPWILEENHSVITASAGEASTCLDYYDLASGLRTASVQLPAEILPWYMESGGAGENVWLMGCDDRTGIPLILRWDYAATATGDDTIYTGPRYTAQMPDEAGLADCAALAETIGRTYGVNILLGEDAVARKPWDYDLACEYQVSVIRRELEVLESALARFPEGFFGQLHSRPNICIVRSVTGSAASGSLDSAGGVQFWDGETPYVVLAAGDGLEQAFYHEMFHILDSQVLSSCRTYYYWHNLNPEGCNYFEDYTSYRTADVSKYLQEEDRVFIDAYSMCYPREDRARIMEYACMPGNSHYFSSEVMQSKLELLCEGIRQAFGLEKVQESFLWEQYLAEPLKIK